MNPQFPLLAPVIALVIWCAVMWAWMYVTRIPAIKASKMVLDGRAPRGEQMATLPAQVRWKADNYNHLLEQPQLFYAVAISLAVLGDTSQTYTFAVSGNIDGSTPFPDPWTTIAAMSSVTTRLHFACSEARNAA